MLGTILSIATMSGQDEDKIKTQRALKQESVLALEGLSLSFSMRDTIASMAIPGLMNYLVQICDSCESDLDLFINAGLRTISRVISTPVEAVSFLKAGYCKTLSKLICAADEIRDRQQGHRSRAIQKHALETLYKVTSQCSDRYVHVLLQSGVADAACVSISHGALKNHDCNATELVKPEEFTKLGLELIQLILAYLDRDDVDAQEVVLFLASVCRRKHVINILCATLLQVDNHESTSSLYGPSLSLYEGKCGAFPSTADAAISTLATIALYCSNTDPSVGSCFWDVLFMKPEKKTVERTRLVFVACGVFLDIIGDAAFLTRHKSNPGRFVAQLSHVRNRILSGLYGTLIDLFASLKANGESVLSIVPLLTKFRVPQLCLLACKDPYTFDSSFQVLDLLLTECKDEILPLFVCEGDPLLSLLDLLSEPNSDINLVRTKPAKVRRLAAKVLGSCGENGVLCDHVKEKTSRTAVIASLCAACIVAEDDSHIIRSEDKHELGLSVSEYCVRGLIGFFFENSPSKSADRSIKMTSLLST